MAVIVLNDFVPSVTIAVCTGGRHPSQPVSVRILESFSWKFGNHPLGYLSVGGARILGTGLGHCITYLLLYNKSPES